MKEFGYQQVAFFDAKNKRKDADVSAFIEFFQKKGKR